MGLGTEMAEESTQLARVLVVGLVAQWAVAMALGWWGVEKGKGKEQGWLEMRLGVKLGGPLWAELLGVMMERLWGEMWGGMKAEKKGEVLVLRMVEVWDGEMVEMSDLGLETRMAEVLGGMTAKGLGSGLG